MMQHTDSSKALPEVLLARYEQAIATLQADSPKPLDVIELLRSRDAVQKVLEDAQAMPQENPLSNEFWIQLATLDERLKQHRKTIATHPKMAAWRESFRPAESAWWWHLKPPADPRDRYDWLWDALAIACLTASVALTQDIAGRFLGNNPGVFSSLGAITPALMTLFAGGGAFTRLGRETLERFLEGTPIQRNRWSETKFGLAATLLVLLILFHMALPRLAVLYNRAGMQRVEAGELATAEASFQRALKLWPNYDEAHYNLGLLYEDLDNPEDAQTQYQLAAQAGMTAAYALLTDLEIANSNYEQAVLSATTGLDQATETPVSAEVLVDLHSGAAWAELKQVQTDETLSPNAKLLLLSDAEAHLQDALALDPQSGRASCLLAQVQDVQGNPAARQAWNQCLQYASTDNTAELRWRMEAQARVGNQMSPAPAPTTPSQTPTPSPPLDDDDLDDG